MYFERLLHIVGDEPVFDTGLLLAGDVDPAHIRRQLSRWAASGRIFQLRRGLYALAPPYQAITPHPFLVANRMSAASYVSLQSALAHYGLIPEYVPTVTSVTSGRPNTWATPLGVFDFRHLRVEYLRGYRAVVLGRRQSALVAMPEKAILDIVYLTPGGDVEDYLRGLRLQNLAQLDVERLHRMAAIFNKPKTIRAVTVVARLREEEASEVVTL